MNHCVPDFETEEDYLIPASSSLSSRTKKSSAMGGDEDIMELLWQNGQVVVQSQNQRSVNNKRFSHIGETAAEVKLIRSDEEPTPSNLFMQEDEMASWLHYPIDDSSLDRYLYTDLLYHPATSAAVSAAAPSLPSPSTVTVPPRPPIPPLRRLEPPESQPKYQNFMHFSRPSVAKERNVISSNSAPTSSKTTTAARQSTVVDSNETPTPAMAEGPESRTSRVADSTAQVSGGNIGTVNAVVGTSSAGREPETAEQSVTSSPGTGSGASASAEPSSQKSLPTVPEDRKRKGREGDDTDCHSEDVEFEYAETKKQARGSTSAKRSRAAEVHNLSERRRRDRINEKMKALQELIPRCNKSDKASMLDEAIEYLKSLQLQVQMMSMGCSMVPMMFPGVQQYMPPMAMGMGMGMGMNMDMGMNRAMVPYPSVLPGPGMSTSPSAAAAAAHMGPRFPVPAFHMPQVPATIGTSRSQAPNHPDVTLGSFVPQNPNQPRMPTFPDPYQQFLSLQQTHLALPQNQAMLQPSGSKASNSKDVRNSEHPHQAG